MSTAQSLARDLATCASLAPSTTGSGRSSQDDGKQPQFAQLYILDPKAQADARCNLFDGVSKDVFEQLQEMLQHVNPFVRIARSAASLLTHDFCIRITQDGVAELTPLERKRYSHQQSGELAGVVPDQQAPQFPYREVVIYLKGSDVEVVTDKNPAYDALHFVLLFCFGSPGWRPGIPRGLPWQSRAPRRKRQRLDESAVEEEAEEGAGNGDGDGEDDAGALAMAGDPEFISDEPDATGSAWSARNEGGKKRRKDVSLLEYTKYRCMERREYNGLMQHFGRLYEEWAIDSYVRIENQRLSYVRSHQDLWRQATVHGLADAIARGDGDAASIGRRVVLPSTFHGSPRHVQQLYQDVMAIVRGTSKPDFFMTMTTNPKWPELLRALDDQEAKDRPDFRRKGVSDEARRAHPRPHERGHLRQGCGARPRDRIPKARSPARAHLDHSCARVQAPGAYGLRRLYLRRNPRCKRGARAVQDRERVHDARAVREAVRKLAVHGRRREREESVHEEVPAPFLRGDDRQRGRVSGVQEASVDQRGAQDGGKEERGRDLRARQQMGRSVQPSTPLALQLPYKRRVLRFCPGDQVHPQVRLQGESPLLFSF